MEAPYVPHLMGEPIRDPVESSGAGTNREHLDSFLLNLSESDAAYLRTRLHFRDSSIAEGVQNLGPQELLAAESYFWDRAMSLDKPRLRVTRLRMWSIFELLRYGALRLVEVLALKARDMDLAGGMVHVGGDEPRDVPLPLTVGRRMARVVEDPSCFPSSGRLFLCDASAVRRSMITCCRACGLPKGALSARSLRYARARELVRQGIPLAVVDIFLGRNAIVQGGQLMVYDTAQAQRLLREEVHGERPMKTSARNVFQGRVTSLRRHGLLVDVTLRTAGGLMVSAVITDESDRRLALTEGKLVNASVKAPWVMVLPPMSPENAVAAENCFPGTVEQVRDDGCVAEVLICLEEGSQICALQSLAAGSSFPHEAGDRVTVLFKGFSVILSL